MRVATRRQRAAWRVFGEAFRPGRTKRYRNGLREIAAPARRGARPRRPARGGRRLPRRPAGRPSSARSSRCSADWREHRDDARVLLIRELDSPRLPALGRRLPRLRPDRGRGRHRRSGRPSRIASATRRRRGSGRPTSRSAPTSRSCAGPTSRRSTSCGSPASGCATRSSSCARRSATTRAPLIARVTALQDHLGLMNDADVAASMARTFLVEHAGDLTPLESAAIGRYLVDREREVARLRRSIGPPWRGVAGPGVPARARAGRRRASDGQLATQPQRASRARASGSRSRQARPAWSTTRIAPSRSPASDTRTRSTP